MSKQPPVPPDQRAPHRQATDVAGRDLPRRESKTGLESRHEGDDGVNLRTKGRQANMAQNLTPRRSVQDR